jgi:transcriptional regulator GlxA family with amidase domain
MPRELPQRIAFILNPNFSMIAFTAAVEPLRIANRLSGRDLYDWRIYSVDGRPVRSSCHIELSPEGDLEQVGKIETVVVCSGIDVHQQNDKALLSWLRKTDRRGADIGAICTATYILAKAGLLDDYRCTIHWENLPSFCEQFPEIEVTTELFEIDRTAARPRVGRAGGGPVHARAHSRRARPSKNVAAGPAWRQARETA